MNVFLKILSLHLAIDIFIAVILARYVLDFEAFLGMLVRLGLLGCRLGFDSFIIKLFGFIDLLLILEN